MKAIRAKRLTMSYRLGAYRRKSYSSYRPYKRRYGGYRKSYYASRGIRRRSYYKYAGARRVLRKAVADVPRMSSTRNGVIVRHREYICDITGSNTFVVQAFNINPGDPATFPWLSKIARNFDEWIPKGIIFEYRSTSSEIVTQAPDGALGTVIMATEYNPYHQTFQSKQEMENYEYARSVKPSLSLLHGVECDKNKNVLKQYFTRSGPTPEGADKRLYDLGIFQLATSGMQQGNGTAGELWVTYEIELRKPAMNDFETQQAWFHTDPNDSSTNGLANALFGTTNNVYLPATDGGVQPTLGAIVSGFSTPIGQFLDTLPYPVGNNFLGGINDLDASNNRTGLKGGTTGRHIYFPPNMSSGIFQCTYLWETHSGNMDNIIPPIITYVNCKQVRMGRNLGGLQSLMTDKSGNSSKVIIYTWWIEIIGLDARLKLEQTGPDIIVVGPWNLWLTRIK